MAVTQAIPITRHPYADGSYKKMLIDGQWVDAASGKKFETFNPATGEVLASVAEGDAEDINRAVAAARRAFEGPWSKVKPFERQNLLLKLADLVEKKLLARGRHTMLLDGDNVRHGLNRDLGFTDADRVENIRRVGEVARLLSEAGLVVLCSFISPFRAERRMVRELTAPAAFLEIFVDTPLEECIRRDPKGLYAKAKAGRIEHFTGLDSPYEAPEDPEIRLSTVGDTAESAADLIIDELRRRRII